METMNSPPPLKLAITIYPGIYAIDDPTTVETTWSELVATFSSHTILLNKDRSPGFGPYRLTAPASTCYAHKDGLPRTTPHRCRSCVVEMTLLVFDADQASSLEEIHACDARLEAAGLARHWYSSFSFNPETKPAFRLLLPIDEPVRPEHWSAFRRLFMTKFQLPADPKQCGGHSHYYHSPSAKQSTVTGQAVHAPVVLSRLGAPVRVRDFIHVGDSVSPLVAARASVKLPDYEPPEEPTEPQDITPLLERLRRTLATLKRNTSSQAKAQWLDRCLSGQALAEHGQRNTSVLVLAGVLAYALPGTPLSVLRHILTPSVQAMMDAGSRSLTWDSVDRMLLTAMRSKWEADALHTAVLERLKQDIKKRDADLPVFAD